MSVESDFDFMKERGDLGWQEWFAAIARVLLTDARLIVSEKAHRLVEVEFYYNGDGHEDPFAHGDPVQETYGRWYFHRDEGSYRGGSFKGLDITFGPVGTVGGILIRTIEDPDGNQINGCSLCVDHLLSVTGEEKVADLDGSIEERSVWDDESPVYLSLGHSDGDDRAVHETARVGLTLKRMYMFKTMPEFIMANYRFLTDARIKKGKVHTVMTLIKQGLDNDEIRALTNSPRKSIDKYRDAYKEAEELEDFNSWRGKKLSTADLCTIHGVWDATYGEASS